MKRLLTITILSGTSFLFLGYRCIYNFEDCDKYRKGTFYFHPKNEGNLIHYTVTRNDTMQIETNNSNKNVAKFKIHWLNNCTYELKFIEGTEVLPENLIALKKKMIVNTTILSGTNSYYIFKSKSNLNDRVFSDTIWLKK